MFLNHFPLIKLMAYTFFYQILQAYKQITETLNDFPIFWLLNFVLQYNAEDVFI